MPEYVDLVDGGFGLWWVTLTPWLILACLILWQACDVIWRTLPNKRGRWICRACGWLLTRKYVCVNMKCRLSKEGTVQRRAK